MPSTPTVQQTLNWSAAFTVGRPSSGVLGFVNEPGLTTANKILATILAPPFRWQWNRVENSGLFTTTQGTSDYLVALSDFGYLEKATWTNPSNSPSTKEIEVFQVLAKDPRQNQPQKIAPILDDGNGNITFRVFPAPDFPGPTSAQTNYVVAGTYQKAPPLLTGLTQTWAPIPDKLAFLYETAMLAHLQGMYSAQLFALGMELFFRQLVGAAEGLSETERNIFLEDKLRGLRMQTEELLSVRQGKGAR